MSENKPISVSNLSMPLLMVVVAVVSIVGGTISGMGTYFGMKGEIDGLGYRLTSLEDSTDEGTQIRLSSLENRLEAVASTKEVRDWTAWRERITTLIAALAAANEADRRRISVLEQELRDLMRNQPR